MKHKKVLILGATDEMIPLMELAKREGYKVLATDRNPDAAGLKYADTAFNTDASDLSKVMGIATAYQIDGILTRTELLLPVLASVCAATGLPGPSEEVAAMSVDKYLFRQKMAAAGLRTPRYCLPESLTGVRHAIDITGIPAIVKPVDYSGSTGVKLVRSLDEAKEAWQNAIKISPSGRAIIEEFLIGREVSVETWSEGRRTHIAAITDKQVSTNDHFVELRHTIPANISSEERELVEEEVQHMAGAMKLNNCITHTEVLITGKGPVIIETGARPGGDNIGLRLVELATGINMNRIMLYLAVGRKVPIPALRNHAAAIQFISDENMALCQTKHDTLVKDPNFVEFCRLREDNPENLSSSADRLAWYLLKAENLQSLNQSIKLFDDD